MDRPARFALHLRLPEWAASPALTVNGKTLDAVPDGDTGYLKIERDWIDGDTVTLALPMQARLLHPHPRVRADTGRVALMRGPLVYCAEGADNGSDLDMMAFGAGLGTVTPGPVPALGGAIALDIPLSVASDKSWGKAIYAAMPPKADTAIRRFIPYYLWDNRDPGEMLVWVRQAATAP